jgi:hypothetical protein
MGILKGFTILIHTVAKTISTNYLYKQPQINGFKKEKAKSITVADPELIQLLAFFDMPATEIY